MNRPEPGSTGLTNELNKEHYERVCEARRRAGLPTAHDKQLASHPLVGRTVREKATGELFTVQLVHESWWKGYYVQATTRQVATGLHRVLVVGSKGCLSQDIAEELERFETGFEVLEFADVPDEVESVH